MRALDVLIFLALVALITWATLRLIARSRGQAQLREARWRPAVHALEGGGYKVVVECPGEPEQMVRLIPPRMEGAEFSTELAEARADAEETAAALNAAR